MDEIYKNNISIIKGKDLGAVQKFLRPLKKLGLEPIIETVQKYGETTRNRDYVRIRIKASVSKEDLNSSYLLGIGGYNEITPTNYKVFNQGLDILVQSQESVYKGSVIPSSTTLTQTINGRKTLITLSFTPNE